MLSVNSFIENVCSACNYPQGPLHTKKAGNCQVLQISQLHAMRGRKCVFVRSQLFGAHLSEALRDRLVCELQSKEIQKKLLTEEHNFDEALKNTLSLEAAEKDVAAFSHEGSTPVNKLGKGNRRHSRPPRHPKSPGKGQGKLNSPPNNSHNSTSPCLSCGKSGHPQSQCKYRQYTCHSCGRSGHIAEACKSKSVRSKLHTAIQSHPNVFQPGLGTIKGITAKLEMKQDAQPKFCKARPVPYALQEAVEAEYSHLESEGIVERVEFSDWAMPMVHVHVVIML